MNSTNSTAASVSASVATFVDFITIFSNIVVCASMTLHLVYYALIVGSKSLRKRTMLYANHVVVVSSFYLIISIGYIQSVYPTFANAAVDQAFCSISEIFWIFSSYTRMYSLLLVAVYRYLAVFKPPWYKRLNDSLLYLTLPLVFIWLISIGLPIAAKYMFNTTTSPVLCLDGYSTSTYETLSYFFFNYTIMTFFPTVTIIVIYIIITRKLNSIGNTLNKKRLANLEMSYSRWVGQSLTNDATNSIRAANTNIEFKKTSERKFANQFIIMCTFMLLTVVGLSIFQLRNIIPNYYTYWNNNGILKVIKTWVDLNIAAIPITSMYYHPDRHKFMKKLSAVINPFLGKN